LDILFIIMMLGTSCTWRCRATRHGNVWSTLRNGCWRWCIAARANTLTKVRFLTLIWITHSLLTAVHIVFGCCLISFHFISRKTVREQQHWKVSKKQQRSTTQHLHL